MVTVHAEAGQDKTVGARIHRDNLRLSKREAAPHWSARP